MYMYMHEGNEVLEYTVEYIEGEFEVASRIRIMKGANTFRQFKIGEAYTDVANRPFNIFRYCTQII